MSVSDTTPVLEIRAVLHFLAWWELEELQEPGFGANVHVNTLLNSPEVLTLERVPYTERLGKGSIVSDCNNSQIDFWEQIVIRVQMPSSSGNFQCWTTGENCSSPCECQTCSIPSAVLGLKACSLLPQITRHYQRLILEVT